jgi:hypothetical protein
MGAKQKAAPMMIESQNAGTVSRSIDVVSCLREASAKTGSDFDYLLTTAMRESRLQPQAKSKNSSASGLFQFIDQTWLSLVKRYGERHGLANYAAAIEQKSSGGCRVASAEMKAAILALRQDPELSALMAGEAARETKEMLESSLGREVNCGELYAAHFLGQAGAKKLITLNDADPRQRADIHFGRAAEANRSVFYHRDGTPKTVGEIYKSLVKTPAPKPSLYQVTQFAAAPRPVKDAITVDKDCRIEEPVATAKATPRSAPAMDYVKYFSALSTPSLPQLSLNLQPALVQILASLDPAETTTRRAA